ncbi:MAG: hypothetical protein ACOYNZ_00655 [Rhodoferax sp.]
MEILAQAIAEAVTVWQQTLLQLNWYHGLISTAYLGAAWLCVFNGYTARNEGGDHAIWYVAATALSLMAANTLLHGDVLVTHTLRSLAKQEGWYGQRRSWQYGTVAVLALIALWTAGRLGRAFAASDVSSVPVALGLTLLLTLLALRTVSVHGVDAVINLRIVGVSVGRWLEFVGIGLVLRGAFQYLRLR